MKERKRLEKALFQVYTGDGKGKTTAAMGLALRAAGHDLRVLIIQFLKGGGFTGEFLAFKKFSNVEYHQFGPSADYAEKVKENERKVGSEFFTRENKKLVNQGLEMAEKAVKSGDYDLVILDELNVAVNFGDADLKRVLALIDSRNPQTELVITGRGAPLPIQEKADLVTEMKLIKHPFQKGILARWGIEY
ncbi:MAG TPA: cob(I)yrinic acid a,c-diamide adenosyltransferase [Candidatus Norongarragalinales archaeon]|jgi:cob(I)alamin adenosyltransferase|nr:cob(I)yrinic acid a,c-diamide adenosyltransferase [Candidatus Norongarragalinales archaeon]